MERLFEYDKLIRLITRLFGGMSLDGFPWGDGIGMVVLMDRMKGWSMSGLLLCSSIGVCICVVGFELGLGGDAEWIWIVRLFVGVAVVVSFL